MDVMDRLTAIIIAQLGVAADAITLEARFAEDLGATSLDRVELVQAAEEEFGIAIPDAEADQLTTVGAAVHYIDQGAGNRIW